MEKINVIYNVYTMKNKLKKTTFNNVTKSEWSDPLYNLVYILNALSK
jgi:hypothetical protein